MDYGRLKTPRTKTTPQNVEEANYASSPLGGTFPLLHIVV